ncbi:MAG: hypothetical protein ABIG46_06415 [Candidatus Omnitrophota bacterium]|nr:hypothetical protein [Candidatus Omnitrophota bacterium]
MDWKENKVIAIGAGAVLVLCIIMIVIILQPKKTLVMLMSDSNQEIFTGKVPNGAKFPLLNPKTKMMDLYPASKVKCEKCGWEGYVITFKKPGEPVDPRCPNCRAQTIYLRSIK